MNLLDVNVLIALCDADHEHHEASRNWFRANSLQGWVTCPLTENGMLRVMSNPRYPGGLGNPEEVRPLLVQLCSLPGPQFWADSVSFSDLLVFPSLQGLSSKQLTDVYLLALAISHGGYLVTFDARIDPRQIPGGMDALRVLPG